MVAFNLFNLPWVTVTVTMTPTNPIMFWMMRLRKTRNAEHRKDRQMPQGEPQYSSVKVGLTLRRLPTHEGDGVVTGASLRVQLPP